MNDDKCLNYITEVLQKGVLLARENTDGKVADYIPELKNVDQEYLAASILLVDGFQTLAGDNPNYYFTLQSVAKLVVLIGLMEEFGREQLFSWIDAEASGHSFASLAQLEKFGETPANPLVNAGAIALCSRIPGSEGEKAQWIHRWVMRLFGQELHPNEAVFASECEHGDRNRSLAYLMKSTSVLQGEVDAVLKNYFRLCSYQATIQQVVFLPMLLANGGVTFDGKRIISEATCDAVVAIMATCGLYNESGMNLVCTGMPAKSGVSGLIIAVATGRGGIAVFSPRVNAKGTSVQGYAVLEHVSEALAWHFASPWGYASNNRFCMT